jgi:PAS domain S-box-containing protein
MPTSSTDSELELPEQIEALSRELADRNPELAGRAPRLEETLLSASQQLRIAAQLIEHSPDLICVVDRHYVYQMANPAYARYYGWPAQDVIGRTVQEVLGSEAFKSVRPYLDRCLRGEIVRYERPLPLPGGPQRDLEVNYYPLKHGEGPVEQVLVVIRDSTERKEVERLKAEFISSVSHELRTPLTSIVGSLGLLNSGVAGELSPQAKTLVDIAHRNSERLTSLVNDLLDVGQIEAGTMAVEVRPVDLMAVIQEAIEANRADAAQSGIQLVLQQGVPGVKVRADAARLRQVLANLLSNAIKFSPRHGTVTIYLTRGPGSVRIAVTDQGSGIPEGFRTRMFQKFTQADASDARPTGGAGLGLSIAKAVMERLGGRIGFNAEPGQGTTFYFELPEWCER